MYVCFNKLHHKNTFLYLQRFYTFYLLIKSIFYFWLVYYIMVRIKFKIKRTISGQGVHEGDSGAGLTHAHGISHYLTGVVSVKDPMTDDSLAVFTNVSYHIGWIHDIFMNNSYRSDDIFL